MRRLPLILSSLILLAHPAMAQDAATGADVTELRQCVAGAGDNPRSCIESIVTPCVDGLSEESEDGVNGCYDREAEAWDALLNENYKSAVQDAQSADESLREFGGGEPTVAASLKTAQRAWIAYRDAECDRLYDRYKDGTIRFTVFAACQNELTASRAIDLAPSGE